VLLEATGNKVRFLQHMIEMLQLKNVEAVHGRAEELAHKAEYRASFDVVTARAVASLPFWSMPRHSVVSTLAKYAEQTWTAAVRAALNQSNHPGVPAAFQEVIGSGHAREKMKAGTSPLWTNTSRTTFTCRIATGLACFIGVSLHRLLLCDL
jgi:hypothetical protein